MAYEQMALKEDEFGQEPIIDDITSPPTSTPNSTRQYDNFFEMSDRPSFQILEDLQGNEEIQKYILNNFEFFMNAVLSFSTSQTYPPEFDYESVVSKLKVNNLIAWRILSDYYDELKQKQKQQDRRAYLMSNPPAYTPQPLPQATYAGGKAKKTTKSKK